MLDHLDATDVAAVYQLDLSLRAMSGFSSDVGQVAGGIRKVAWFPPSTFADQIQESILAYQSSMASRNMKERLGRSSVLEGERLDWTRERVYNTLDDLAGVFEAPSKAGASSSSVSSGFPLTAAGDVERERGGFAPAFRDLKRTPRPPRRNGLFGRRRRRAADGGLHRGQIDWRAAVGKLGMEETFLTDVGLERLTLGLAQQERAASSWEVIANETGGRLLTSSDLSRAFETIHEESANFYRVSVRVPEGHDDGRYKRITVRVTRPNTVVSARRGRYSDVFPHTAAVAAGRTGHRESTPPRATSRWSCTRA